jgi:hypothetical protein
VTWVATGAEDCNWDHGGESIAEEVDDSKLCKNLYETEAEPHLSGRFSHQKLHDN